ncbi:Serine/threonine-protein kinase [Hibiscus syriacus]|uniref:Serine/threonine-protein kinase n=1 Tax=Hibiscus syriacus TaxID=106335 RepID=A0A6A3A680_HIBSY|nr:Serine/threonine-protein kinase [Hibiscus syriacus]
MHQKKSEVQIGKENSGVSSDFNPKPAAVHHNLPPHQLQQFNYHHGLYQFSDITAAKATPISVFPQIVIHSPPEDDAIAPALPSSSPPTLYKRPLSTQTPSLARTPTLYFIECHPADGKGDEPLVVAIKKLNKNGLPGHKQWVVEVQFLGVVNHPNLAKLVGYCTIDGEKGIQRLLVYGFMQNKSLEDHIFRRVFPPLSWKTRLQIILGAAQGLAYLHEGLELQIIYRDFETSNVLLDDNFNPKLLDFRLAREGPMAGWTHVSTLVVGTYGYAAPVTPDYIETRHLTDKSDKQRPKMSEVVDSLKEIIQVSEEVNAEETESPLKADETDENSNNSNNGVSESWKRRMAHLARLGERV